MLFFMFSSFLRFNVQRIRRLRTFVKHKKKDARKRPSKFDDPLRVMPALGCPKPKASYAVDRARASRVRGYASRNRSQACGSQVVRLPPRGTVQASAHPVNRKLAIGSGWRIPEPVKRGRG